MDQKEAGIKIYNRKGWLIPEFIILFIGAPLLLYFDSSIVHPSSVLVFLLAGILMFLRYKTDFRFKELVIFNLDKKLILRHALILLSVSLCMLAAVWIFFPEKLFNLPRGNLLIWLVISLFYPVFSAYAQEVIYRTFLFRRYQTIFPKKWMIILASATVFSFVHIVYYSPVSIILTFIGGIYLARVYYETRSVLYSGIIHGIMGDIVFTIGLGEFFWLDMMDYL